MISPDSPLDHVTPYDRFAWGDEQIELWLASGEHQRELSAYFGAAEYQALAALARRARRAPLETEGCGHDASASHRRARGQNGRGISLVRRL